MLLAVPEFKGRVAPTFDFCRHLTFWWVDAQRASQVGERWLSKQGADDRVQILLSNRVEVLLCGAIGKDLKQLLQWRGIRVDPDFSGLLADVVSLFGKNAFHPLREQQSPCPIIPMPEGRPKLT
ncbi:MAG: NifB/NifX family molybdenum-iron cluster-binding protein [Acidobacteriia bacterium]|nr:NifB/NifX family molybdenum-iron cluster-binding protein [Terriglobia bacterium]